MDTTDKNILRKEYFKRRNDIPPDEHNEKSNLIQQKAIELIQSLNAKSIYSYYSYRSEVKTEFLNQTILEKNLHLGLPRINKKRMDFYTVMNLAEDLQEGSFGIREPVFAAPKCDYTNIDMVFVPGIIFDYHGNRVGYGKGYYDRFFKNHFDFPKVAIAFELQLRDEVPVGKKDQKVDYLISEKKVYEF